MLTVALILLNTASAGPELLDAEGDEPGPRFDAGDEDPLYDLGLRVRTVRPATIVGGQLAAGRSNVVALAGIDGGGMATVFCSASVIQRRWVLTAAHCLTGARDIEAYGLQLHVIWGDDIVSSGYTHAIPWADAITFPGYTDSVFANDVGLVELAEPTPSWVPLTVLNDVPLDDSWISTPLTFVGYGLTSDNANDVGVMRETSIPIEGYDEQFVYAYAGSTNVCQGDSGGPSFRLVNGREEQVGINSFVTPGCVGGSSGSANVVEFLGFLREHVPDLLVEPAPTGPGAGGGFGAGVGESFYGPGIGMRFGPHDGPGPGEGCSTTGAPVAVGWLAIAAALLTRRRGR